VLAGRSIAVRLHRFPGNTAISKPYLLTYPDGSRKHITRIERDDLLLAGCARLTAARRYLFTGKSFLFHSLSDLSAMKLLSTSNLWHFLPGSFIFELKGKRHSERLETPESLSQRISNAS
jgi:hypothetical protein